MNVRSGNISVVVCAYTDERWDDMVAMVESMRCQTHTPFETILVIDHNPDLLVRARHAFNDIVVIENQKARGLSGARNSGLAIAKGDLIAFMDEDAFAEPAWLETLCQHFADKNVVGVGGAIIPNWSDHRPDWFPSEFNWVVGCTYVGMPESVAPVRNIIGCNMAFRRNVFAQVGGFRDGIGRIGTFPAGCEETELCIRTSQQIPGCTIIYEPLARVHHHVTFNRSTLRYFVHRCFAEGRSKALISRLVGTKDGLASERAYIQRTLPLGVLRGIAGTFRRDLHGLQRAGAIVLGLMLTGCGYVSGWFTFRREPVEAIVAVA